MFTNKIKGEILSSRFLEPGTIVTIEASKKGIKLFSEKENRIISMTDVESIEDNKDWGVIDIYAPENNTIVIPMIETPEENEFKEYLIKYFGDTMSRNYVYEQMCEVKKYIGIVPKEEINALSLKAFANVAKFYSVLRQEDICLFMEAMGEITRQIETSTSYPWYSRIG